MTSMLEKIFWYKKVVPWLITIGRITLEKEYEILKTKLSEVHRDVASLRAEKLQLESERAKTVIEKQVFESEREHLEMKVREATKKTQESGSVVFILC